MALQGLGSLENSNPPLHTPHLTLQNLLRLYQLQKFGSDFGADLSQRNPIHQIYDLQNARSDNRVETNSHESVNYSSPNIAHPGYYTSFNKPTDNNILYPSSSSGDEDLFAAIQCNGAPNNITSPNLPHVSHDPSTPQRYHDASNAGSCHNQSNDQNLLNSIYDGLGVSTDFFSPTGQSPIPNAFGNCSDQEFNPTFLSMRSETLSLPNVESRSQFNTNHALIKNFKDNNHDKLFLNYYTDAAYDEDLDCGDYDSISPKSISSIESDVAANLTKSGGSSNFNLGNGNSHVGVFNSDAMAKDHANTCKQRLKNSSQFLRATSPIAKIGSKPLGVAKMKQVISARERRRQISQKLSALKMLIPNGRTLDTSTLLTETIGYVKKLQCNIGQLLAYHDALN